MTTPATKTVKVDSITHQRLKVIAAKNNEHVYELVRRLAKEAMQAPTTNGVRKGRVGK